MAETEELFAEVVVDQGGGDFEAIAPSSLVRDAMACTYHANIIALWERAP